MKFFILFTVFGFIAVIATPSRDELINSAKSLESRLNVVIEKQGTSNPTDLANLKTEKLQLQILIGDLNNVTLGDIISLPDLDHFDKRLTIIQSRFEQTLQHINGLTVKPTTGHITAIPITRPTLRPSTISPVSAKTTVQVTVKPTTRGVPTIVPVASTTLSPIQLKEGLLKRAAELQVGVKIEMDKLNSEGRAKQAVALQKLETEVIRIAARLQKTTQLDILQLLDSELFWLESRLNIEILSLQAQERRGQILMKIATALSQRIASVLKVLGNTPVGNALKGEATILDKVSAELKTAKDDISLDDLELQLVSIEDRVNQELEPIGVLTATRF